MAVGGADVIVVGGGHNGLICAAYLARAGIDTLVLEARSEVGGCASTVTDLGARFNICHCDHTMIRALPIVDELELERHGLRYLSPDAVNVHLFHDHSPPWVQFHSPEATVDGLAHHYPHQVDAYRRYLADALPVARFVLDVVRTQPSAARLSARAASGHRREAAARLMRWARRSAQDVLASYFDDWHLRLPAISTGPTVWGIPATTPNTGLAALNYATRHLVGTGRPQGGSGMLPAATRASFETAGGRVRCGAKVTALTVRDGTVTGVRLTDGTEIAARAVVAACDPHEVFLHWLDGALPPAAARSAARWRARPTFDGYESKLDAVLSAPPRFAALAELEGLFPGVNLLTPTATVNPTPAELDEAHRLKTEGRVAEHPTHLVNAPSVLDPTMAPAPGQHVFSLETLFTPYALPGGWPGSDEPARWLDLWASLAEPGFRDTVVRWRAMTPDRYESEFFMARGHAPSYVASPLATLTGRNRELSRYRTPIGGLYLTGAATFPGAGIFGASGRNTAHTVRADLQGPLRRPLAAARRAGRRLPLPA